MITEIGKWIKGELKISPYIHCYNSGFSYISMYYFYYLKYLSSKIR